ncbi:MAG TPA: TrbC/VirB2 family protein [Rickettsiales bacterium]|nr:TrbC/VirB2 family protein [Rickettsiales bacterium]
MKKLSFLVTKVTVLSFFMLMLAPALLLVANDVYADTSSVTGSMVAADANQNALVGTMCNVLKIVTGNFGKAFAAFAIISIGIGFFTGKVSWGLMIGVAAGIAAMFGAPTIVAAISGKNAFDCGQ